MAALQNLDGGQRSTGFMYMTGFGVTQDHAEALRWLLLAAAQGEPQALEMVANCYEHGRGTSRDGYLARVYYSRAVAAGSCTAADALADFRV
jgi:uncharacterized protein